MATVEIQVDVCDKCEAQGVTSHSITVNGKQYVLDLCQRHGDKFLQVVEAWTSLGVEVEQTRMFTQETISQARRIAEMRARDEQRRLDRERTERDLIQAQRVAEHNARRSIPGAARWDLTNHAKVRMDERGYSVVDVFLAVTNPELRIEQPWKGKGRAVYVRGECKVVASELDGMIITVLSRETELEPDPRRVLASTH